MLVELDYEVRHSIRQDSVQHDVDGSGQIGRNCGVVFKDKHGLIFWHFVHDFPHACVVDEDADAFVVAEVTCLALQPLIPQFGLALLRDEIKLARIEQFAEKRTAGQARRDFHAPLQRIGGEHQTVTERRPSSVQRGAKACCNFPRLQYVWAFEHNVSCYAQDRHTEPQLGGPLRRNEFAGRLQRRARLIRLLPHHRVRTTTRLLGVIRTPRPSIDIPARTPAHGSKQLSEAFLRRLLGALQEKNH